MPRRDATAREDSGNPGRIGGGARLTRWRSCCLDKCLMEETILRARTASVERFEDGECARARRPWNASTTRSGGSSRDDRPRWILGMRTSQ
jgi:hypothetical protein